VIKLMVEFAMANRRAQSMSMIEMMAAAASVKKES
jgi:hypothetical protein